MIISQKMLLSSPDTIVLGSETMQREMQRPGVRLTTHSFSYPKFLLLFPPLLVNTLPQSMVQILRIFGTLEGPKLLGQKEREAISGDLECHTEELD